MALPRVLGLLSRPTASSPDGTCWEAELWEPGWGFGTFSWLLFLPSTVATVPGHPWAPWGWEGPCSSHVPVLLQLGVVTGCDMPGGTAPPHPPLLCPPSPKGHSWLSSASASPQLPRPPESAGLCFSSFLHLWAAPGVGPGARQGQQSNTLCVLQGCSPGPACFGPGTQGLTPELNSSRRVESKLLSETRAPWPCAAAQLLLKVLSHPSSALGLQLGTVLPPCPQQAARACQGCRRGSVADFWDCCAQREGMTHSLAASWEVPMNINQADGASKYLFPRVKQEQHIHRCYKETEKQKQTRPGPAKRSQKLLSFPSIPWPNVLCRLSALKLTATG